MRYGFKGFTKDLTAHMRGYQYKLGEWNECGTGGIAQCHNNGLHCADNPLDCITNGYSWDGENRFFLVGLDGDIHQDDDYDTQLSATRMYLVKELTLKEFVYYAMTHIQEHNYQELHRMINLNIVCGSNKPFEICYGTNPLAIGIQGQVIGLIQVNDKKEVIAMNMFEVGVDEGYEPGVCYDVYGNVITAETLETRKGEIFMNALSGKS
ncbi:MAG: hypothetical protein IKW81_09170 [Pseudobutyrivibrio sp.]|nr:hypothetical protein [Pseudobutyrivibrio sp.]